MIVSERKYNKILNTFLLLIACTVYFRLLCTVVIILFSFFCILNYKKISLKKEQIPFLLIISSPFLIELFFFWNNNSFEGGIKSIEKYLALLVFSIFIVGNLERIRFYKILKKYVIISISLTFVLLIRFIIISPKFFSVYLKGNELWESGYEFVRSFGMHAPAFNMHLAFVTVASFWLIFKVVKKKKKTQIIGLVFLTSLSFFMVLIVNTRLALGQVFLGFLVVFYFEVIKNYNIKKILLIFIGLLFLSGTTFYLYLQKNPYMKEKYFKVTFAHIDKVGNLDSVENPEATIYNSLVTRLSIWKSSLDLGVKNLPFGVGSSNGNTELFNYYKATNQNFLARSKFPPHNQFLNSTIKFGYLGFLMVSFYIFSIGFLGIREKKPIIISFFIIFLLSNLVDDFLVRFDGIVFSGFWFSMFVANSFKQKLGQVKSF